ncbi:MAG: NADH-quinone oxidoreductase subunit J family protein [Bacteroidia bacterium]
MTVTHILFIVLSLMAILSGLFTIFSKNPVFSALWLIVAFFAIAGHYILLNAQFLAVVHIIVYAGAIMVLFLYVVFMINLNKETEPNKPAWVRIAAVVAGGMMMLTLIGALKGASIVPQNKSAEVLNIGLASNLGKVLFNDFLVPFELSSILLLAAMVGAVMLGKRQIH